MARLTVTYKDGRSAEVTTTPWSEIQVERKYGIGAGAMSTLEQYYYMAWASLEQDGQALGEFDVWAKTLADVTTVKGQESSDPTRPAQPPPDSST